VKESLDPTTRAIRLHSVGNVIIEVGNGRIIIRGGNDGPPRSYQRKILAAGVDAEVCMERWCCRALGSAVCKNDDGAAGWNAVIGELPVCQACGQVRKVQAIETL